MTYKLKLFLVIQKKKKFINIKSFKNYVFFFLMFQLPKKKKKKRKERKKANSLNFIHTQTISSFRD